MLSSKQEVTDLRGISEMFSIPLNTTRKWASERKFPGIIKVSRRVFVDVEKFRAWFYKGEVKIELEEDES